MGAVERAPAVSLADFGGFFGGGFFGGGGGCFDGGFVGGSGFVVLPLFGAPVDT